MKKKLLKILTILLINDPIWFIFKPFLLFANYLVNEKNSIRERKEDAAFKQILRNSIFKKLEILNGPFKGMKYPNIESVGSAIYPKLFGSYEKELWNVIENCKKNNYSEIIDIGCAEGYYAVGLAINTNDTMVYAFDTSEKARELCKDMAAFNNVQHKIIIKPQCTATNLATFPFTGRGLIVCDCEGSEIEIFTKMNIFNLTNCDLIIETHDLIDINISNYLKEIFSETHNIYSIKSIDDIEKAHIYNLNGLENLTLSERKKVLAENRGAIMEWLICSSKIDYSF